MKVSRSADSFWCSNNEDKRLVIAKPKPFSRRPYCISHDFNLRYYSLFSETIRMIPAEIILGNKSIILIEKVEMWYTFTHIYTHQGGT